jgi:flagellar basal-body rod protein FlgC
MGMGQILAVTNVSASGMAAERVRMEVIANNLANAHTTRTPEGGPYRRRQVLFMPELDARLAAGRAGSSDARGVRVVGIEADPSELPRIYQPGHPDADADGLVTMPNVRPANEMVDLVTATRAYEANLRALRTFREMVEQTLAILRGA